jgi:hypothetical protein
MSETLNLRQSINEEVLRIPNNSREVGDWLYQGDPLAGLSRERLMDCIYDLVALIRRSEK